MRINDIYLAYVSWGKAGKQRPILIVDYDVQTLSFYAITSKYHHKSKAMQAIRYPLVDWQKEGLAKQSYVVIDPKYQILRFGSHFTRLSSLSARDVIGLRNFLKTAEKVTSYNK